MPLFGRARSLPRQVSANHLLCLTKVLEDSRSTLLASLTPCWSELRVLVQPSSVGRFLLFSVEESVKRLGTHDLATQQVPCQGYLICRSRRPQPSGAATEETGRVLVSLATRLVLASTSRSLPCQLLSPSLYKISRKRRKACGRVSGSWTCRRLGRGDDPQICACLAPRWRLVRRILSVVPRSGLWTTYPEVRSASSIAFTMFQS